jgi:hypothetical protein
MLTAASLLIVLAFFAVLPNTWVDSRLLSINCPWRVLTGFRCPGCGGTRALIHLADADFAGAMAMHPPITLAMAGAILLGALSIAAPAATDRLLDRFAALARTRFLRAGLAVLLVAQMVFGRG